MHSPDLIALIWRSWEVILAAREHFFYRTISKLARSIPNVRNCWTISASCVVIQFDWSDQLLQILQCTVSIYSLHCTLCICWQYGGDKIITSIRTNTIRVVVVVLEMDWYMVVVESVLWISIWSTGGVEMANDAQRRNKPIGSARIWAELQQSD